MTFDCNNYHMYPCASKLQRMGGIMLQSALDTGGAIEEIYTRFGNKVFQCLVPCIFSFYLILCFLMEDWS